MDFSDFPRGGLLFRKLILASAAWMAMATGSSAAIIPSLDFVTPVASEYQYFYSATLAGDQGLVPGSRLVIFDFAGYVAGSISAGIYTADLLATVENTSTLLPPPGQTDDPTLVNLVFTWRGAPFLASGGPFADVDFAGLSARSTFNTTRLGAFSAQAVTNSGLATGEDAFNTGRVAVAVGPRITVPEPSTWALMILGFGAAGAVVRRRQSAAQAG
jgi:hypothetical protein